MITDCRAKVFNTHFGWAGVIATDLGICRIVLPKKEKKAVVRELENAEREARSVEISSVRNSSAAVLSTAVRILEKYFSGVKVTFDLPLDIRYYTVFQQAVWQAALEIPFGETRSYAWIARKIRNPKASRAVGQAMGANPIPVIIP